MAALNLHNQFLATEFDVFNIAATKTRS